jgi:hypothetical protein
MTEYAYDNSKHLATKISPLYAHSGFKPRTNLATEVQFRTVSERRIISKKYFRPGGLAPSEPSETPRWRYTPRLASIPRVTLHIALQLMFHRFFSRCRFRILKERSGIVATCEHTLDWVHWVHAGIRIAMGWVMLQKSLFAFRLPPRKIQFSLYLLYGITRR